MELSPSQESENPSPQQEQTSLQEPISQDLAQDSQQGLPLSEATEITGTEDAPDQASLAEAVETLESE